MATDQNDKRRKFERSGPVAVRATAIGVMLDCDAPAAVEVADGVACVTIRGPLVQYAGSFWDSYESVLARVTEAVRSEARAVVLKIHSPGGDVFGTFETARAMRALFDAAGKDSVAYVEGEASSAAYALACSCSRIVLTETSLIGSVGVINQIGSFARAEAAQGIDVVLVTSGERKADGNPHALITDGAIAANQQVVDDLAGVFWRWVTERRGIDPEGFEAGVFVGTRAVAVGLADEVDTESNLRANLTRGTSTAEAKPMPTETSAQAKGPTMADQKVNVQPAALSASSKYAEACKVLAEAAEEGDDRARKALKQLAKAADEGDDKADESKKDDDKGDDAKAASDGGEKKEEAKASSISAASSAGPSALESATRARLIAARPDLANDAEIQKLFASCSIVDLKTAVETLPKAEFKAPAAPPAGTRGGQATSDVVRDASEDLDARMGLKPHNRMAVTKAPGIIVFGGTAAQASREIASFEAFRNGGNSK